MDGSISLGPAGRRGLMEMYRRHPDPAVRRRAHIVLLLADGRSWLFIESALYCRRRAIDRWKKRFEAGGIEALLGERRGRRSSYGPWLIALVVTWGTTKFPRYFYEPYGATLVADWDGAPWVPGDGPDDLPDSWSPMSPREEPVPIHQIEPVPPEESPGNPSRFGNALMWTGQRLGPPVGLYEFLARPYSPAVGRWQQRDPMGALDLVGQFFYDARTGQITWFPLEIYAGDEYGDMLNLYQYAMLNPVLYLDPTGRNVTTWLASKFLEATGGDQSWLDNPETVGKVSMCFGLAGTSILGGAFIVASAPAIVAAAQSFQMLIATASSGGGAALLSRWPGPNAGPQIINGIRYTTHALMRMMPRGLAFEGNRLASRGVPPSVVENAIKYGQRFTTGIPGRVKIVYENVVVFFEPAVNTVVSVRKGL